MLMNRQITLLLLLIHAFIFADSYDEAIKEESKGNYTQANIYFREYFDKNINDENQDSIIEKLIYSSTLYQTIDESLLYLLDYVKYMKNKESRYRIYLKISEIYELRGDLLNAGIFYEKAAYTNPDFIDYNSLINSLEILLELGFYEKVEEKCVIIMDKKDLNDSVLDRLNLIISISLFYQNKKVESVKYLKKIKNYVTGLNYWKYIITGEAKNIEDGNLETYVINKNYLKLRSPNDYIFNESYINSGSNVGKYSSDEVEIFVGSYTNKADLESLLNIISQMNLKWYIDKINTTYHLYIFTDNEEKIILDFNKLGIKLGGINVRN